MFDGKLKLKNVETIYSNAFYAIGFGSAAGTSNVRIWIPKTCTRITFDASNTATTAFAQANSSVKLYCEVTAKPPNQHTLWFFRGDSSALEVHWGVSEEQFDALQKGRKTMLYKPNMIENNTDLQKIYEAVQGLPKASEVAENARHGKYAQKKFTSKNGEYLETVVSDDMNKDPENGRGVLLSAC